MKYSKSLVDFFRNHPSDHRADVAVVMVHGYLAMGRAFGPMRAELSKRFGADVYAPSYAPHESFESVVTRIERGVRLRRQGRKLFWVGHSLGGIYCRHIAETMGLGGDFLITLGTPHLGIPRAPLVPRMLKSALNRSTGASRRLRRVPEMPHLFIAGSKDVIVPVPSAAPAGANVFVAHGRGHNGLLTDKGVHRIVVSTLEAEL